MKEIRNCEACVSKHRARLRWAYKAAAEYKSKESECHKRYYDRKFKCMDLAPGDLVFVWVNVPCPDHHKIADKWSLWGD